MFIGCTDPAATIFGVGGAGAPGNQTILNASYVNSATGVAMSNGSQYITGLGLNPLIDDDDGSCTYTGCMDDTYANYICNDPTYGGYLCDNGTTPGAPGIVFPDQFPNAGTTNDCTGQIITGCMDDTPGTNDPLNPNASTYLQNNDVNGDGNYLAANYNPNATVAGPCYYYHCPDTNAFNYSSTGPNGLPYQNSSQYGVLDLCQYEGCTDNQVQSSPDPQTPVPGYSNPTLYYYNQFNYGCQDSSTTNTITGYLFVNGLDPQDTSCCPNEGCMDDGQQDQQWWVANGYSAPNALAQGVTVTNYPNVQATNYNSSFTVQAPAGSPLACTYPLGCTDNGAPNFNPNAIIDDGSCLPYCKRIRAKQCNPQTVVPYYKWFDCAHIDDNEPVQDKEFLAMGVSSTYGEPENTPPMMPCPNNYCQSGGQLGNPFGGPGAYIGVTQTTTGQNGTWGCTYVWTQSCWSLQPSGQTGFAQEPVKEKPAYSTQMAVFKVEQIVDDTGPNVNNYSSWDCSQAPPVISSPGTGNVGKPFDTDGIEAEPVRKSDITEVEISKKLREALKNMYK